jgi:hypothetical protein
MRQLRTCSSLARVKMTFVGHKAETVVFDSRHSLLLPSRMPPGKETKKTGSNGPAQLMAADVAADSISTKSDAKWLSDDGLTSLRQKRL